MFKNSFIWKLSGVFWQNPHRDQIMYLKHFVQVNCFNLSLAFQLRSGAHTSFNAYIIHEIKGSIIYLRCHVSYNSLVGCSLTCFRALFRSCPGTQCLQDSTLEEWRMMGRDAVSLGALFNNNSNFSNNNRPYSLMPRGRPAPKLSILLYTDKPGCRAHENDELKDSEKSPAPACVHIWTFLCTYKNAHELTHQPWSAISAISISLPIVWRNYKYYSIVCSCVHYFIDFSLVSWTPQPCQTGKRAHTL